MMLGLAIVVLATNVAFGLATPRLVRGLTPELATRLIAVVAFATTLASGFVLCVLCFDFLGQTPAVAAAEDWSSSSLSLNAPVPLVVGLLALIGVIAASARAVLRVAVVGEDLWTSQVAARALSPSDGDVAVIEDDGPDAFALAGLSRGRVVVTSAMLAALDADEARVLLAHEASHLRHRHHLYIALADLAVAANPLLGRTARVVRMSAERWADEDAARLTGDRVLTARAVARAGLATLNAPPRMRSIAALAIDGSAVTQRTRALLAPAPQTRRPMVAVVFAILLVTLAGTYAVAHLTEHRFEQAHAAYAGHN
ncbi:MAG: M56 family metallopeptidase [Actinomycetales bacterium]